jgi:septal ring factor EnvC (AmiA/AmiB activator)
MKHLRKFNESEEINISSDRINEINKELENFVYITQDKLKFVDSLINELNNYKNESNGGNDQIDDSIIALQVIKKNIEDSVDKIDTVVNNLKDYNDNGRKFLYTETK